MKILVREIAGVRQREWNSERLLVFPACTCIDIDTAVKTTHGTVQDIRKRLTQRMDIDDTENELLRCAG